MMLNAVIHVLVGLICEVQLFYKVELKCKMQFSQMVASTEPASPRVPLLAKFGKPRAPLVNSVSCSSVT